MKPYIAISICLISMGTGCLLIPLLVVGITLISLGVIIDGGVLCNFLQDKRHKK